MHTANLGEYSHTPSTLSKGDGEIHDTTTELVQPGDLRVPCKQSSGSRLGYREAQREGEGTNVKPYPGFRGSKLLTVLRKKV